MASNILFVDDETEIIESYRKLFDNPAAKKSDELATELFGVEQTPVTSTMEHRVFTAYQGNDAVEIVRSQLMKQDPIDIAFLDMRMPPGIDGSETAAKMRKLDPKLEIVIVTAYSDIDLSELLRKVNRPDKLIYLKKPFSSDEITQLINNLSEKAHLERSQEKFLANVSHELKTPLSSILGFSKILTQEAGLDDEYLEMANVIHRSAEVMRVLISDLIDTALLGERKIALDVTEFDVNELLHNVEREFSCSEYKDRVQVKCRTDIGKYTGDLVRVTQCLTNLIINGLKFSKDIVTVSAEVVNGKIHFEVNDNGVGIPLEEQESIFRRFYRIEDEHHALEGMGLGLSICDQIAKLHSGEIILSSEVGKGSTFTVII